MPFVSIYEGGQDFQSRFCLFSWVQLSCAHSKKNGCSGVNYANNVTRPLDISALAKLHPCSNSLYASPKEGVQDLVIAESPCLVVLTQVLHLQHRVLHAEEHEAGLNLAPAQCFFDLLAPARVTSPSARARRPWSVEQFPQRRSWRSK